MSQESKFWTLFGKFSVAVTTLGALVAIWVVVSQSSEELELEIRSDYYSISPDLEAAVNSNFKAFDHPKSMELVERLLPSEAEHNQGSVADELGSLRQELNRKSIADALEQAHEDSWLGFSKYGLDGYRGISRLTLSNTGEKTATSIKIDIPVEGIARWSHPDTGTHVAKFSGVLAVDDLRAGKVVQIVLWSNSHLGAYEFNKIDVTHENGVGSVTWPIEATGLSWFFAEYSFFGPLILYLLFMIGMIVGSFGKKSGGKENTDE